MKRFFFIITVIVFVCAVTACQQSTEPAIPSETIKPTLTLEPTKIVEPTETTANTIPYLTADELAVNGISRETTREEIIQKLGQPINIEQDELNAEWHDYGDVQYVFEDKEDLTVGYIIIKNKTNQTPRNIQIGDKFKDVLDKFPQEKDYRLNNGLFYGEENQPSNNGSSFGWVSETSDSGRPTICVVSEKGSPFMKIHFKDDIVEWMQIFYTWM